MSSCTYCLFQKLKNTRLEFWRLTCNEVLHAKIRSFKREDISKINRWKIKNVTNEGSGSFLWIRAKKSPRNFTTPYLNQFLSVLNESKALYIFCNRGKGSKAGCCFCLDEGLVNTKNRQMEYCSCPNICHIWQVWHVQITGQKKHLKNVQKLYKIYLSKDVTLK